MKRYWPGYGHQEGGIAKVLGALFVIIGIYALLDFYNVFSVKAIPSNYVFIGCAVGAILGGLYMIGKGGSEHNIRY